MWLAIVIAAATIGMQDPQPAFADAYLDAGARELVRLARERRLTTERSIERYEALARERISFGVRALRRERMIYRRETAARIDWRRDGTVEMEVLGAREAIPIAKSDVGLPVSLRRFARHLAFDPTDLRLLLDTRERPENVGDDDDVRHPLAPGSEADYRFASGDTTVIRLQDGRRLRLIELRVLPRRRDFRLLGGSYWFEAETHAPVQATLRLARPFDLERDGDPKGLEDVPRLVRGMVMPVRADVRYITIEYGLWEMKWWMPRLIALEGVAELGSFLRAPLRYELEYRDYTVHGELLAPEVADTIRVGISRDSLPRQATNAQCRNRRCHLFDVRIPEDSLALLTSEHLPGSIYDEQSTFITEQELRDLADRLRRIADAPWQLEAPRLSWGLGRSGLVRYNRVEGLSVGARADMDFGRLTADASVRFGFADREPNGELGVVRPTRTADYRLGAYRRLVPADPLSRPLGLGNSFSALVFGRDDGEYFRALGVELTGASADALDPWFTWRIFAERQTPAAVETDFSVRRLLDKDHVFRPNIVADSADQYGAALTLRAGRGLDPAAFRWNASTTVEAATGDFRYVKPSVTVWLGIPLGGPLTGALEAAAGTTAGDVPVQSLWYLGGPATLRGYAGGSARGEAFWRGRAEIGTAFPAARIAAFVDAGRAGPRREFRLDPTLVSTGVGVSLFDGMVRLDLARALRDPIRWRFDMYVDAAL